MLNKNTECEIKIAFNDEGCQYCSQATETLICEMCLKHMEGVVLVICRNMLHNEGRKIKKLPKKDQKSEKKDGKKSDGDKPDEKKPAENKNTESNASESKVGGRKKGKDNTIKELDISEVLNRFPDELAERTSQFPKALKNEGVWFTHLLAYQFVASLRQDKNPNPAQIMTDMMYHTISEKVFSFLEKGSSSLSKEGREFLDQIYSNKKAPLDGKRVIKMMAFQLQEMGRLKIDLGPTYCLGCGAELNTGEKVCDDCAKDESDDTRRAIASQLIKPIIPGLEDIAPPVPKKGMHTHKKSS